MVIRRTYLLPVDWLPRTNIYVFCFQSPRSFYKRLAAAIVLTSTICLVVGQRALAEPANMSASPTPGAADQKAAQIVIPVYLNTALDSKKRSTGDQVEGKTAAPVKLADGMLIPRGAKVVGHITEAKARSKGDTESSLTMVFDSLTAPGGRTINIKAYPRAIAPNANESDAGGGVGYSGLNQTVEHTQSGTSVSDPVPVLTEQSVGVHGIKNLTLGSDGVLRSDAKTVKLDRGSQMMLRAEVVNAP